MSDLRNKRLDNKRLVCEDLGLCSFRVLSNSEISDDLRDRISKVLEVIKSKKRLVEVLHPIFVLMTHREGFGFNRVIFILVGEDFRPLFALGPRDHQEGLEIYSKLANYPFDESLTNYDATLKDTKKLKDFFDSVLEFYKFKDNPIDEVLRDGKSTVITYTKAKEENVYSLLTLFGSTAIAMIPVNFEGLDLKGLFVIDNVVTLSPINMRDVELIERVIEVLKPYIERAYLFEVIEEKEKSIEKLREVIDEKQSSIIAMERLNLARELTSSIVHEIRNPVTIIGGYANQLLRVLKQDGFSPTEGDIKKLRELADHIYINALRIDNILKSLDDLNATLRVRKIKLNLCYVVRKTVKEITKKFGDLKVHMEIPDKAIYVEGDMIQISKFIQNAITNSYEAMVSKGIDEPVVVRIKRNEGYVDLIIEDKAGGIPDEILPRIYEPFFTTKAHGSGLGIPIMLMIAKEHKATMKIENTSNGVRVILTMPEYFGG